MKKQSIALGIPLYILYRYQDLDVQYIHAQNVKDDKLLITVIEEMKEIEKYYPNIRKFILGG